jgi:hypothetical protein
MSYRPKPELSSSVPAIPDHIYYDVLITNFNSTTGTPIPIYFNENRTNPIIPTTGEYEMSIIRFQVDTPDLPSFIPVIKPFQNKNNLTEYVITLTITPATDPSGVALLTPKTYISQANVIWVTQDSSAFVPPDPSNNGGYQSNVGDYYYCYSYQHFQSLIDATLARAFTYLKLTLTNAGYNSSAVNKELTGVLSPIFSWDTTTQCAVISTPQFKADGVSPAFETRFLDASGNIAGNPTGVKMYFNSPLYQLFTSFNAIFKGQNNSFTATTTGQGYYQDPSGTYLSVPIPSPPDNLPVTLTGLNYEITILNQQGTNQIIIPNIYKNTIPTNSSTTQNLFIQTFQEFSTTINWTPVESIVFVSNTLPIVSNQLASPLIYNENQIISGNGNNARFAQVITDIISNEQSYKPSLLYNPTAEYRMISLTGNQPLTNVDISVFWRNKLGNIIPLNLLSGGSCSLKFLFRKRIV